MKQNDVATFLQLKGKKARNDVYSLDYESVYQMFYLYKREVSIKA